MEPTQAWPAAMRRLLAGEDLPPAVAEAVIEGLLTGALGEVEGAAFLTALAQKGPAVDELVGLARGLRARMRRVVAEGPLLDTCGTGGSGRDTPNTSTLAAFVAAAGGARVAKHGNRASSGRCGSSDLLEAVGVPVALAPEAAGAVLDAVGIVFLFAPAYHPALKAVAPLRRRLGFRTVFNFLGPLCNPAGASRQLLGVSDPGMAPRMAEALRRLGSERVLVVHGAGGLDELSADGPSQAWEVTSSEVRQYPVIPEELGLRAPSGALPEGGDVPTNRAVFEAVLAGQGGPTAALVALNAGAALWVAQRVGDLAEGVAAARELLASGAARQRFERYREAALDHAGGSHVAPA